MTQALTIANHNLILAGPTGSLESYIQAVNAVPMLDKESEFELARHLREEDDLEAARQLVMSQLRFVVHIARGYSGYGLALGDLIQEGNIGLMKAVKRFDPAVNVRLVSFAVHWIRAEIHEYVLKNWKLVKVATTKAQRKLFFNLRSAKKRLGWLSKEEVDGVAKDLGVPSKTVLEMEQRLSAHDTGYDRCCKYRPFRRFDVATRKPARNVRGKFNQRTGMCCPIGRSLVADVDHCRPVALVDMT